MTSNLFTSSLFWLVNFVVVNIVVGSNFILIYIIKQILYLCCTHIQVIYIGNTQCPVDKQSFYIGIILIGPFCGRKYRCRYTILRPESLLTHVSAWIHRHIDNNYPCSVVTIHKDIYISTLGTHIKCNDLASCRINKFCICIK